MYILKNVLSNHIIYLIFKIFVMLSQIPFMNTSCMSFSDDGATMITTKASLPG